MLTIMDANAELFGFSSRQREMLSIILSGATTYNALAYELGVSAQSVHSQLRRMYDKTSADNMSHMLARLIGTC